MPLKFLYIDTHPHSQADTNTVPCLLTDKEVTECLSVNLLKHFGD